MLGREIGILLKHCRCSCSTILELVVPSRSESQVRLEGAVEALGLEEGLEQQGCWKFADFRGRYL